MVRDLGKRGHSLIGFRWSLDFGGPCGEAQAVKHPSRGLCRQEVAVALTEGDATERTSCQGGYRVGVRQHVGSGRPNPGL